VTDPFKIVTVPATVEAASTFRLDIETPEFPSVDLNGTELSIRDAEGLEVARTAIVRGSDGVHVPAPMPVGLVAPSATGHHVWHAVVCDAQSEAEEDSDAPPEHALAIPFGVEVAAHTIFVSVWDLPAAIEAGRPFAATVGLKCTCGCDTRGWAFSVTDAEGHTLCAGKVGDTPAEGTDALYVARIDLPAPSRPGVTAWTVTALCPDHPMPHALRGLPLRLNVTEPADVAIRLRVVDAETGEAVPRAKIVAHPFRAFADDRGEAVLRVARGQYRIFASGRGYFASQRLAEVTDDLDLVAELHRDRDPSPADTWA
jgi:hypothetical protein